MSSLAAPDFVEPAVAWRIWRVLETREDFRLQSVVYGTVWPAGEPMVSRCLRYRFSFLPWRRRECDQGWRASHAYPLQLFLPAEDARRVRGPALEEVALALTDYGVPVEILECSGRRALLDVLADADLRACA